MKRLLLLLAAFNLLAPSQAELSKTYPTSAVTTLRLEAYLDAIQTSSAKDYTVKTSTWDVLGFNYTFIYSTQTVSGYVWYGSSSVPSIWTIDQYNRLMAEGIKNRIYETILDQQEIYMVWPDTNPVAGWRGWCLGVISGKKIPITCP